MLLVCKNKLTGQEIHEGLSIVKGTKINEINIDCEDCCLLGVTLYGLAACYRHLRRDSYVHFLGRISV